MRIKKTMSGIGAVLLVYPVAFLLPFFTGLIYGESFFSLVIIFLIPAALSLSLGAFLTEWGEWKLRKELELRPAEALMVVALSWIFIAVIGAFPYMLNGVLPHFVDSYFESMSGFTTTGASVITEIDGLERSILIWRAFTQWLGGLGVIVLMVALFSILMGGPKAGMMLMRGEVPGHSSGRIVHRIKDTAKILWMIYGFLTVVEVVMLSVLGLSVYDAICHTFTTLSTGGYGTHTASIAYWENLPTAPFIEMVFVLFMFLGGVNFVLHYNFIIKGIRSYLKDIEFRVYFLMLLAFIVIITADLIIGGGKSLGTSLRGSVFTVVSIQTTTGYVTADFDSWPALSRFAVLLAMFVGGMTGSTGGGMKIARFIIASKIMTRSLRRIGHPRAHMPIQVGGVKFNENIIRGVGLFIFGYIVIFLISVFLITLTGLDVVSSLSAVAATLGNVGPGLGLVGPKSNYASVNVFAKVVLSTLMWIGRLEIITCFVLFIPENWRS